MWAWGSRLNSATEPTREPTRPPPRVSQTHVEANSRFVTRFVTSPPRHLPILSSNWPPRASQTHVENVFLGLPVLCTRPEHPGGHGLHVRLRRTWRTGYRVLPVCHSLADADLPHTPPRAS